MEDMIVRQTEKTLDPGSVFVASLILQDVHETIRSIRAIATILLRYMDVSLSIKHHLIGWVAPAVSEQN